MNHSEKKTQKHKQQLYGSIEKFSMEMAKELIKTSATPPDILDNKDSANKIDSDIYEKRQIEDDIKSKGSYPSQRITSSYADTTTNKMKQTPSNNFDTTFKQCNINISSTNNSPNQQRIATNNTKQSNTRNKTPNHNLTASTSYDITGSKVEIIIKPCDDSFDYNNTSQNENEVCNPNVFDLSIKNNNLLARTSQSKTRNKYSNSNNKYLNKRLTFYEKSLKHKERHENEIEILKRKALKKEDKSLMFHDENKIVRNQSYMNIPIYERGIELHHKKLLKVELNEKMNINKDRNLCVIGNKKQPQHIIDKFIKEQFDWKEKINMKHKGKIALQTNNKSFDKQLLSENEIKRNLIKEIKTNNKISFKSKPKNKMPLTTGNNKCNKIQKGNNKLKIENQSIFMFNFEQRDITKSGNITTSSLNATSRSKDRSKTKTRKKYHHSQNHYNNMNIQSISLSSRFSKESIHKKAEIIKNDFNNQTDIKGKQINYTPSIVIGLNKKNNSTLNINRQDCQYVQSSNNISSSSVIPNNYNNNSINTQPLPFSKNNNNNSITTNNNNILISNN